MMRLIEVRDTLIGNLEGTELELEIMSDKKWREETIKFQVRAQDMIRKINSHLQGWRPKE